MNSAWCSIEMTTIGKMHPTLQNCPNILLIFLDLRIEKNQLSIRIEDPPKEPSSLGTYEPTYSCKSVCS